jgi:hypothetical protein
MCCVEYPSFVHRCWSKILHIFLRNYRTLLRFWKMDILISDRQFYFLNVTICRNFDRHRGYLFFVALFILTKGLFRILITVSHFAVRQPACPPFLEGGPCRGRRKGSQAALVGLGMKWTPTPGARQNWRTVDNPGARQRVTAARQPELPPTQSPIWTQFELNLNLFRGQQHRDWAPEKVIFLAPKKWRSDRLPIRCDSWWSVGRSTHHFCTL